MISDWALVGIFFLLSVNFFSVTWVTVFKSLRYFVASIFVFALTQALFVGIGWGIGKLIFPMLSVLLFSIPGVILTFIGIKRFLAYFTTKRGLLHFQVNKITDMLAVAVAASMEAFLVGVALVFITEDVNFSLLWAFLFPIIMSILGYIFSKKRDSLEFSLLIKLLSGIGMVILSLPLFKV